MLRYISINIFRLLRLITICTFLNGSIFSFSPVYVNVKSFTAKDVQQLISNLHALLPEEVEKLIDLGAVSYRDLRLGDEKIVWERLSRNQSLEECMQLRIYFEPRRYPSCYVNWKTRVVSLKSIDGEEVSEKGKDYIIVDKPAMLPCMAHPSNTMEHLIPCVKR